MRPRKIRTASVVLAALALGGGLALQIAGCAKVGRQYTTSACTAGETRGCYDGPSGTEGAGICRGGTQTCGNDDKFGPCEGEVTPHAPNCHNGLDNDCDGAKDVCTLAYEWAHTFADTNFSLDEYANALTVDPSGNVIITGGYAGTLQFGTSPLPVPLGGESPFYVAKFDTQGHVLWSRGFKPPAGGTLYANPTAITTDASGNVFVTGDFQGSVQFGPNTYTSTNGGAHDDMFLLALQPDGTFDWATTLGDTSTGYLRTYGVSVAVNGAGQPVVALGFDGNLSVAGKNLVSGGSNALALVRYDTTGFASSATAFPGSFSIANVAFDSQGNMVVGGGFAGSLTFGATTLSTPSYNDDIFVAKLQGNGNTIWAKQFGDVQGDDAFSMAIDSADDVVIGGFFSGQFSFGAGPGLGVTSQGSSSLFLAKLDKNGKGVWAKAFGELLFGVPVLAKGDSDSIVYGGYFAGLSLSFGGDTFQSPFDDAGVSTGLSGFLAKLDKDGRHLGSRMITGPSGQQGIFAVGADTSGAPFAAGRSQGEMDLGNGPIGQIPDGGNQVIEIFVAKYAP